MIPLHFLNEEENEKEKKPIEEKSDKDDLPMKSLAKSIEEMQISWKTASKLSTFTVENNNDVPPTFQPISELIEPELSTTVENVTTKSNDDNIESLENYNEEEFTNEIQALKIEEEIVSVDVQPNIVDATLTSIVTNETTLPTISVVIVNYNVRDFLQNCLQSLYNSTIHDTMQVIVVDNNSTDQSIEMVKKNFPSVECISLEENIGFGKANNLAIEYCTAPITLLLNPDTIVEPNTLQTMVDYLNNNPTVGVAGCKLLNADGSFQLPCRRGFPTPWVSFCKIFGLQSLFPTSSLFARYNQTFRSENETYTVDAVSGAFMAIRTDLLREVSGFDPDFFMYGEDLDLCYRIQKRGWDIAYVHTTSTIHFKGESTKRSSINEHKHFYEAMEIFASKHIAGSKLFLLFLQLGIQIKAIVDFVLQNRIQIVTTILDILIVNGSLLIATKIRMGEYFAFPDFAYPTVFLVFTLLLPTMYLFVGVYDKKTPSFTTTLTSYLIMFFFLSSLTYFFKEYAFSRGIMLMTIGGGIIGSFIVRSIGYYQQKIRTKTSTKKAAIIGVTEIGLTIANELKSTQSLRIEFLGYISTKKHSFSGVNVDSIIGDVENLPAIIEKHSIQEIVITDESIQISEIMAMMQGSHRRQVRFHISNKLDDLYTNTLINEVSGLENSQYTWNIVLLRNRIIKRLFDIVISTFLLTFGFPVVYLKKNTGVFTVESLKEVLFGRKSIVGIYGNSAQNLAKSGLIGLAHRTNQDIATKQIIDNLNEFYAKQYSLSMDIEILLKFLVQKK